jgi:hypothetical protein
MYKIDLVMLLLLKVSKQLVLPEILQKDHPSTQKR